jgi:serine/threonine-protein kinase
VELKGKKPGDVLSTLSPMVDPLSHHSSRTSAETPVARTGDPMYATNAPRFADDGVIGRGGMGEIHRIYDRNIRRFAALKVLDSEHTEQLEARRRFLGEAQITGQLEHPNIVPVYDLELNEIGVPRHFTMMLVEGETLTHFLRPDQIPQRTDAELWELLNAFLRVCDAVAYAHSRGVVHRDLKPDNIMIGPYGQVYVMDWGIARAGGSPVSEPPPPPDEAGLFTQRGRTSPVHVDVDTHDEGNVVGTHQYMAPEQAWGRTRDIDARTDVFALGGILYHMLTGRAPYAGNKSALAVEMARAGLVEHPSAVVPQGTPLSPALCTIAMKALAADREDRYQSVEALKRDVERAQRGGLSLGTRTFPKGKIILREGDPPDAAYILTRGRCEAYRGAGKDRRVLREMGAGDVFGEMALLSSMPRSASVVAIEDATAIVVTQEALAREVHSESWLFPLLKTLVERFRELEARTGT